MPDALQMKRAALLAFAASAALLSAPPAPSVRFPAAAESAARAAAQKPAGYEHPFQNPELPAEGRITNLLSLMTLEEKVECLGTDPSVPRLGVRAAGHSEGLHGLAQGGPARWGRERPTTTTTFPQAYGLGETWDVDIVRRAAGAAKARRAALFIWRASGTASA